MISMCKQYYRVCFVVLICINEVICSGTILRLTGGTRFDGIVEIFHNGKWGIVCDDGFDLNTYGPSIVCKMLGLSRYGAYVEDFKDGVGKVIIDQVDCQAYVNDLASCPGYNIGTACNHNEDAGIVCGSTSKFTSGANFVEGKTFGTTLVGGPVPWEGIVQMRLNSVKGVVCSTGFDDADAAVVCRYLGYTPIGAKAVDSNLYSDQMTGGYIYRDFSCTGNEDRPELCVYNTSSVCKTSKFAAVKCKHTNIRLVGGSTKGEGQLEVQNEQGVWGSVCGTGFDRKDANVVCKMLGFGDTAVEFSTSSKYLSDTGPTFLSNLQCKGSELDILACDNVVWNSTCSHRHDVGINCKSSKVRLVGPSPYSGRLEMYYNGSWGTVCDNSFDSKDASVVCRMLGFEVASARVDGGARFGQGTGKVWFGGINCIGDENDLTQCSDSHFSDSTCPHSKDVSVTCFTDFKARLTGNQRNTKHEGRLELYVNGEWFRVCDQDFTYEQADAACKYMGYPGSVRIYNSNHFGKGSGRYLSMLGPCSYDKSTGWQCIMRREYAGLSFCDAVGITCASTELRLVDGPTSHEGRIEVKHNGVWGSLCCEGFSDEGAAVVCKSLGFSGYREVLLHGNYGRGSGPVWAKNVRCKNDSTDIYDCIDSWKDDSCTHACDVGVKCFNTPVRLINGSAPFQGRVEVYHNNNWGTIQSLVGGDTICSMLNYNMSDVSSRTINGNVFGLSLNRQWLGSTLCDAGDMDIEGCLFHNNLAWSSSGGATSNAGVRCLLTIRLANGPNGNSGRVEIRRNGVWGTVCSKTLSNNLATEICKMAVFGLHTTHVTGYAMPLGFYGPGTGSIWRLKDGCLNDVARCLDSESEHEECSHDNDVGVYCETNIQTNLEGGNSKNEGRIVFKLQNNETAGLCDTSWDTTDAEAVCKRLGYWVNTATPRSNSWFGSSVGPMWHLSPDCMSDDNDVTLCNGGNMLGQSYCSRLHEAGVSCIKTNLGKASIRLVSGPGPWKGKLEVETSRGKWGGFCMSNWDDKNTQVACRTLQFRPRSGYHSYGLTAFPIFLNSLNCTGTEDDIGLCPGDYDVRGCSTIAVGIDCSGGILVNLVNGSSPYEGRVEVYIAGEWKSVCDINWDRNDAKTVCSMLGLPNTNPVVQRNAKFGQSVSQGRIDDLGCTGWESHLSQCSIHDGGVCQHTSDAAVQCIACFHEYHSETGQISSPNFPGNYTSPNDCVYVIKPGSSKSYTLSVDKLNLYSGDTIEIKEGPFGKHLATLSTTQIPIDVLSGSEFFVRFMSQSSNTGEGFQLSWRSLALSDVIKVGCGSDTWDVSVNMTLLRQLYNDSIEELLYFPDANCRGVWRDDTVVFPYKYTDCRTQRHDWNGEILYFNKLMYPEAMSPNPPIIRNYRWEKDVACRILKSNNGFINFHPFEQTLRTTSSSLLNGVVGSGKERINIEFFNDPHFFQEIHGNPVNLQIGNNVYVKVTAVSTNDDYKMRLHTCFAAPSIFSSADDMYMLIKDGCQADPTTHIISQSLHETRFYFNAFEFPQTKDNVYVECNATFCPIYDNGVGCNQTCNRNKRSQDVDIKPYFVRNGHQYPVLSVKSKIVQKTEERNRRSF